MLVSQIITNGLQLADMPNTNFYSSAESLQAVQDGYGDLYQLLCDNNDDYYQTQVYVQSSTFTADANAPYMYFYTLPADFFRLRLLQAQGQTSGTWIVVQKMTIENYGITQNSPAYRFAQGKLHIYDPSAYSVYRVFYYPVPTTLTTNTDITYPSTLIPQILAYRLAVEIRRKQGNMERMQILQQRLNELTQTMVAQLPRDDNKAETVKNTMSNGFAPYI